MVDGFELKMCMDCRKMLPVSRFSSVAGSPAAVCKRCWRLREKQYRQSLQRVYVEELGGLPPSLPSSPDAYGLPALSVRSTRQAPVGSPEGTSRPTRWIQENEHVLSMRYRDGMTLEAIAQVEGVSRQAICTKIWRFTTWVDSYFGQVIVDALGDSQVTIPKSARWLQHLEPLLRLRVQERLTYDAIGRVVGRSPGGVMYALQKFYAWLEQEYDVPVPEHRERHSSPSRWLLRVEPILRMCYREGLGKAETAQALGKSRAYISEVLRRFNMFFLDLSESLGDPEGSWLHSKQEIIRMRYVEEASYAAIAKEFSCTWGDIRGVIEDFCKFVEGTYGSEKPNRISRSVRAARWLQRNESVLRLSYSRGMGAEEVAWRLGVTPAWITYVLEVFTNWLGEEYPTPN